MATNFRIQKSVAQVLQSDNRVIFAYLCGSSIAEMKYNDIDIAVYTSPDSTPLDISTDIQIELSSVTDIAPDVFDFKIISHLLGNIDIFTLLYLKDVFENGILIVNKDEDLRTDLIESYGMKYRECEGLIAEVLD